MARKPLFKRIAPGVRQLDSLGQLERFLDVLDTGFDNATEKIRGMLTLHDVDNIEDKYLPLLAPAVGHRWRSGRTYDWNRSGIRDAFHRHSYKTTNDSIEDLLRDYGAQWWKITDIASRLDIWNRQGGWNSPNGIVMDANFYHEGAYLLEFDASLDFDAFLEDFGDVERLGAFWFFSKRTEPTVISMGMQGSFQTVVEMDSCARDYSGLNWNRASHAIWMKEDEVYQSGVLGRYLMANSSLPVNAPGLALNMGTYDNPLTEPWSLMQAPVVIVTEENK